MAREIKMSVETTLDEDTGEVSLAIEFATGETRAFAVKPGDKLYSQFAAHGAEQKIRDRIAGKDGKECITLIDSLLDQLNSGEWSGKRASRGESGGLLVKALAALSGKTVEETMVIVKTLDKKQQAALRADPVIAAKIEELRPAKVAPKGVDLDALKAVMGLA